MSRLSLLVLAATVAFPGAAMAQVHHSGPGPQVRHGGSHMMMRHHRGARHPGRHFRHHRLNRGFVIHPFWFGPQFHVQNWQMYGFANPGADQRWVRYYDDAYLIDRDGRVRDERYGLDWDQYGERWEDDEGIPAYHGSRDYHPDDEDYAWVERHGGSESAEGWDYGGYGQASAGCRPAPQPCGGHGGGHGGGYGQGGGYGHGGGYGYYGYGVAYPIVIETTVVTGGTSYYEEVIEETVEVRQRQRHRPRRHRPPPPRRPRPPAGERG